MKKRWIVLLLAGAFVLYWFSLTERLRYRLTVEMDTPAGLRSGASVIAVSRRWPPFFDPLPASVRRAEGEAVYVDLGGGRHVIAVLASGAKAEGSDWVLLVHEVAATPADIASGRGMAAARRQEGQVVELPAQRRPTLVTFGDINDPASARVVHAMGYRQVCRQQAGNRDCGVKDDVPAPIDEIAQTFGPGHALRRITLEIVPAGVWPFSLIPAPWPQWLFGAPVTRGIEARLPWLGKARFDDMRNTNGSALPLEQRQYLATILGGLRRDF